MDQVQKTEMVRDFIAKLKATSMCLAGMFCIFSNSFFFLQNLIERMEATVHL